MLSIKHPDYRILPAVLLTPFIIEGLPGTSASADDAVKQRKNPYAIDIARTRGFKKKQREEDSV